MLTIATNIRCLNCHKKLCKLKDYEEGTFIEIKHKAKAFVLTKEALVGCVGCKQVFHITAEEGITNQNRTLIEELSIGSG